MNKRILVILVAIIVIMCAGCGKSDKELKLGTAKEGGIYYSFGNELADILSDEGDINVQTKETSGSAANIRLISGGYIDMGIAQADLVDNAINQTGDFKDNKYDGFSAIASLYTEYCHIVVMADSGIEKIDDLIGKTVCIGEKESGSERNALQILSAYGLNDSLVKIVNLDYNEAENELKAGKIDALFVTMGLNTSMIEDITKDGDVKLLQIEDNQINKLIKTNTFFEKCTIPKDTYRHQEEEINTVAVNSVLLVNDSVDEDIVYKITKCLFEKDTKQKLNKIADMNSDYNISADNIPVKIHEGAKKYYKENNVDIN